MKKCKLVGILGIALLGMLVVGEAFAATANLNWKPPTARENGKALALSEISHYEVQYRGVGENTYKILSVPGIATFTTVPNIVATNKYEFRIAVFDTDGLASNFVQLTEVISNPPKPVTVATFTVVP